MANVSSGLFALALQTLPAASTCRQPLASPTCLVAWLGLSAPFVAAGGIYSLLALRRRRLGAPSRAALVGTIGFGFVFAFVTATLLAVLLDVLHWHSSSLAFEVFEFLAWVLVLQGLYVRLVIRLWVWLWGK